MDITFGVIPTIVLASQSYRLGQNLATEYKTFNDDLRRVLTDIATTIAIFKHTIDQLVGEIAGDTPELTFEYLGSGKWDKDDLNAQLESILGSYFDPLKDSMCRTHETIQKIGNLLLLMTGTAISPPGKKNKLSFLRWPNSVAPVTPPTIEVNPLRSEFKTTQIQSTRKKLLSVANSHLPGLRGLLDELRTHKDNSRATLKHALRKVSRSTAGNSTEISRIPPRRNSDNF